MLDVGLCFGLCLCVCRHTWPWNEIPNLWVAGLQPEHPSQTLSMQLRCQGPSQSVEEPQCESTVCAVFHAIGARDGQLMVEGMMEERCLCFPCNAT